MGVYLYLHIFCKDKEYWKKRIDTVLEWDFGSFQAEGSIKDVVDFFRYKKVDCCIVNHMKSLFSEDDKVLNKILNGTTKSGGNSFIVRCPFCGKLHNFSAQTILKNNDIICQDCRKYYEKINMYGSLSSNIKGIENYWVFEKNTDTPDKVPFTSTGKDRCKTFTVICPNCGKEHNKTKNGIVKSGNVLCRSCALSKGYAKIDIENSLYNTYPAIAKMFDKGGNTVSSKDVYPSSNKVYNFKCTEGHIFEAMLNSMTRFECINSKYKGCPYCSGRKVVKELSFGYCSPNVASLWDYEKNNGVTPYDVMRSSGKEYWFKCKNGHSFYTSPNTISRSENSPYLGCKECRTGFTPGVNDLETIEPNIVRYWDNRNLKKPSEIKVDTQNKNNNVLYWMHCDKGHLYQQSACKIIKGFKNGIKSCPVCSGQILQQGVNDLLTLKPEVAEYWDYDRNSINPCDITPFSHKEAWFKCIICGDSFYSSVSDRSKSAGYCNHCASRYNQSLAEKEIIAWLTDLGYDVKTDLVLGDKNYKYDIYIPDKNFVIEYNGIYYHSEKKHNDRYYHYNKYMCCKSKGLSFMAVWEDDYKRDKDLVKKMILRKLGDSEELKNNARACSIVNCCKLDAYEFLNCNHIQGFVDMCSYVALTDKKGSMLAVLAYTISNNILFIKRYATSCILRGGFSKLLKYLETLYNVESVETFSDNAVSDGSLYSKLGFERVKELPPDYSYVYHGGKRIHKFNLRKSNFEKDVNLYYDSTLTERELADINNLYRIWDYGKVKWVKYCT